MARHFALFSVLVLSGLVPWAGSQKVTAADRPRHSSGPAQNLPGGSVPSEVAPVPKERQPADPAEARVLYVPPSAMVPMLSSGVRLVSQIAVRNGDRFFLVIDKMHGKIALFENGEAVFAAAALTGQSIADVMPPDAIGKTYAEQVGVKYKVTPAGRFTVSPGHDQKYGAVWDINEIQGKDWSIAIHQVALASPAQTRGARLRSANDDDKHITDGCIDVELTTIQRLTRLLGDRREIPLYILPMEEALLAKLFPSRVTADVRRPPDG